MLLLRPRSETLLFDTLQAGIRTGTLHVVTPGGVRHTFVGEAPGSEAEWHIRDRQTIRSLAARGDIGLGETYAAGMWDADNPEALFRIFVDNLDRLDRLANGNLFSRWIAKAVNALVRRNSLRGSRRNIRAHYDVGNDFYRLWLDRSMTYSSALYEHDDADLETAQAAKYRRILQRIGPDRGPILEIGCGWGGFAEAAAEVGHRVTGITLSPAQQRFADERLGAKADIRLLDYRQTTGTFGAIASIEMFEAVGRRYWPTYFATLKQRLATDGVALVQTITVRDDAFDAYASRSDYLRHYVFPGGMLPSIAEFTKAADRAGLRCREVFRFGPDYARTLREWRQRFDAQERHIRALGYDNAFIRSWRMYLSMCAASFSGHRTDVVQVELVHA